MIRLAALILLPLVSTAALAQSGALERLRALQASPAATKSAAEQGKRAAFFCVNCHGEDGNSHIPEVPSMAGQSPAYLIEQMRKFGSGERRDQFMQGLIKVLKDEERAQIALYYASEKPRAEKVNPALASRGKTPYEQLCANCHGAQARGNDTIPRLAGQKITYQDLSLSRYRNRSGERNDPLMAAATEKLGKGDISALAHYLASLD